MDDGNEGREVEVNSGTLPAEGIENADRVLGVHELRDDLEDETIVEAVVTVVAPLDSPFCSEDCLKALFIVVEPSDSGVDVGDVGKAGDAGGTSGRLVAGRTIPLSFVCGTNHSCGRLSCLLSSNRWRTFSGI